MPDDGAASLLHGLAGDINELIAQRWRLRIALISDGAHELLEKFATDVGGRLAQTISVVDFRHTIEKLAAAVPLLGPEPDRRLARWRLRLLNV